MTKTFEQFVASDRLPSLPQVALRVIELARDPEPDFGEVVRTVRTDPALSSKILRTTNSALFGLRQSVQSIEAAIPMLGITLVRTIVLGFTLATPRPGERDILLPLQRLWRSCLTQAVFAELLAMEIDGADPPTYFLAGLLQDIGILAALHVDPENYLTHVWKTSEFPNVVASERQYYGFTHLELARALCGRWGIPEEICEAIACHHSRMQTTSPNLDRPLVTALQAAHHCAQYVENHHKSSDRHFDHLVTFLTEHYDWPLEETEDALRETIVRVGETTALYSFDVGGGYSTERILDDAKRILEEIAVHSQLESMAQTKHGSNGSAAASGTNALEEELMRDALTGAYNRRFMDRVLNERLASNIRSETPMGILFLDVDGFKHINDQHGHQVGDEALCHVAKILHNCVRKWDNVIRYGGDEFLVAMMRVADVEVENIAERIRGEIHNARLKGHPTVRLASSIGALHYRPDADDPLDANWLIDHVDKAMYEAKKNGGNQVRLYHVLGEKQLSAAATPCSA